MQTRQTELAGIEQMLREQLARTQAAEQAGRRSPLGRLVTRVPWRRGSGTPPPSPVAVLASVGSLLARPTPERRHEDALAALFARDGDGARIAPVSATSHRQTSRLPNLSGNGANSGAMKQVPERDWGPPPAVQFPMPAKKEGRRSDLVIAGLGLALGLTCALFPWYIFFNQDQFGVQAIRFGGRGPNAGRAKVDARPGSGGTPLAEQNIPDSALDLLSTGTLQVKPDKAKAASLEQQPFPAEATEFRLIHIANGRAMIEDDAGLWVVQQGSVLPDSSVVRSIEKRNGQWVLVTSTDRIIEVSK